MSDKPNKLDELVENWSNDSVIDGKDLSGEIIRTPKLQSKYLKIRLDASMMSKKLGFQYKEKRHWKAQYFNGDFNNPDDLKKYNVPAWSGPFVRIQTEALLDNDKELNEILMKKVVYDEIVEFCNLVIQELKNRTFAINGAIKWNIFTSGG